MERKLDVIIVEDDQQDCKAMSKAVESAFENFDLIGVTDSSNAALKIISESNPDIVILDLELSWGQGTGFDVLKGIKDLYLTYPPYTVITTNNISAVTHAYVRELGADFIFVKTQNGYTPEAVVNFLKGARHSIAGRRPSDSSIDVTERHAPQWTKNIRKSIGNELLKIGISPKNIGFNYLLEAVYLILDDCKSPITSVVAQNFKKTQTSVERAMQNAINRTWATENIDDLLENYTAKISSAKGVPTITEFIYYCAHKIKS